MVPDSVYLNKCERACRDIYRLTRDFPAVSIIVYGSLARYTLGLGSDIDIMVVLDTDVNSIDNYRRIFFDRTPEYFEVEFPYVDVRFARKELYDKPGNNEYGDYIRNCRKDGIIVWRKNQFSD